jgi:uncharacterized protein (UPF0332 family)
LTDEALSDIEEMLEADVSVRSLYSRLYYAIFYSAKAILLKRGFEPKTHRGTASQFYQEIYAEGDFRKEGAILLQRLQEKRDMADYELEVNFDESDFKEDYLKAQRFIEKIKSEIG